MMTSVLSTSDVQTGGTERPGCKSPPRGYRGEVTKVRNGHVRNYMREGGALKMRNTIVAKGLGLASLSLALLFGGCFSAPSREEAIQDHERLQRKALLEFLGNRDRVVVGVDPMPMGSCPRKTCRMAYLSPQGYRGNRADALDPILDLMKEDGIAHTYVVERDNVLGYIYVPNGHWTIGAWMVRRMEDGEIRVSWVSDVRLDRLRERYRDFIRGSGVASGDSGVPFEM
jgi:hypothetical protein